MPLRQAPVVEWPATLAPLLQEAQITFGSDGKPVCRIDVDVDAQTLLAIHEFEAHLRHRPVQLRLAGSADCMTGAMSPSFGLGAPSDRIGHIAKVRLSFHGLRGGECVEATEGDYDLPRLVRLEGFSPCAHVFFAGRAPLTDAIAWL